MEQIYAWRTTGGLGVPTIAARLNTDLVAFPAPGSSGCWQDATIGKILRNPKYTGYQVYGRTTIRNGRRGRRTPQDQWLWSDEPAHPPIITRQMWDAAQLAAAQHGTSRDDPGVANHPQAKTVYALRGIVTCSLCGRRMTSHSKAGRRGQTYTYYRCSYNPKNPRMAAEVPGHPTVQVREDHLQALLAEFFDTRIFGPDRARYLAATITRIPAASARNRQKESEKLARRLKEIDTAEDAYAREIEQLATTSATAPAIIALRTRILARFTELETERTAVNTKLDELAATDPAAPDPGLLDRLPRLAGLLHRAPADLQQGLYRIFRVKMTYNHAASEVALRAAITSHTANDLHALTASQHPAATASPGSTDAATLLPNALYRQQGAPHD